MMLVCIHQLTAQQDGRVATVVSGDGSPSLDQLDGLWTICSAANIVSQLYNRPFQNQWWRTCAD